MTLRTKPKRMCVPMHLPRLHQAKALRGSQLLLEALKLLPLLLLPGLVRDALQKRLEHGGLRRLLLLLLQHPPCHCIRLPHLPLLLLLLQELPVLLLLVLLH